MKPVIHVMIPARYDSTRLPGKLLMDIHGKTVLERVWLQAKQADAASITIATDSEKIKAHALAFGAEVCMTRPDHQSGTDRIAEVVKQRNFSDESIIVNLQADEPFLSPLLIKQVGAVLTHSSAPVATLCWPIERLEQLTSPQVVKVVFNQHHNALYFSRSAIPANRDAPSNINDCWRHIGLYAYRAAFLKNWDLLTGCALEQRECLEQLRILWSGVAIRVEAAKILPMQDINTQEDLVRARQLSEVD